MDAKGLYRQFLEMNRKAGPDFPGGRLVRAGPSSVSVIPKNDSGTILKIIRPGHTPFGLPVREEFNLMQNLQGLTGRWFVLPRPLGYGAHPIYLHMERLGDSLALRPFPAELAPLAGRAIGEFSGRLFQEHGMIHRDIWQSNYTLAPDGRIGVIDIASIASADVPEHLFTTPLMYKPNIAPYVAAEFKNVTGRQMDIDLAERLVTERIAQFGSSHTSEDHRRIMTHARTNLEEWRDMDRRGIDLGSLSHG